MAAGVVFGHVGVDAAGGLAGLVAGDVDACAVRGHTVRNVPGGGAELPSPQGVARRGGDEAAFEGFEGEPEGQLNPKKKVWDDCQVGFTTTDDRIVGFEAAKVEKLQGSESAKSSTVALLKTKQGTCSVKSLVGATVR